MLDIKLLEKLCLTNGVAGDECRVKDIIISEIKDFVSDIKVDNLGNIIVFKKGKKRASKKLLISAHMDEIGFIITHITDDGFLKFANVGGIDSSVMLGKGVLIGDKNIPGVIGTKPVHLMEADEKRRNSDIRDMYIDIGAANKEQALEFVKPGEFACFDSIFDVTENGMIRSKAIDDRVGCFILIDLLKQDLDFDMHFAFLVQEEVGLRGAEVAAYAVNPEAAIVIDATTACDIPSVSDDKKVCIVGEGPVISFMDGRTIYDKEYYKLALESSKTTGAKTQLKKAIAGGNDAGAIHRSRSGVRTVSISLPCRYLHSAVSLISKQDLEDTIKTVKETARLIIEN